MKDVENVLNFFREICAIPHASYDEKRISDYLVSFAQSRGLEVEQDDYLNVLIKKPATLEGCKCAPVIIQGHMDMVYVRDPDCARDYEDGIAVVERNGWLCAEGTTLGADNGIALALALALLDSEDTTHPDLEVVLTVEEEVGLTGAEHFDMSRLKGKYFINLDTEEEGVFYTSCAGAFRNDLVIPIETEKVHWKMAIKVDLSGLSGGHSGMEIHLGRGNAIVLMGRLLDTLDWEGAHLVSLGCDGKMNAIATNCEAVLYVDGNRAYEAVRHCEESVAQFNLELKGKDSVTLRIESESKPVMQCFTEESRLRAVSALSMIPNGVFGFSKAVPELVETSANPGILTQEDDRVIISSCVRSSVAKEKQRFMKRFEEVARLLGGASMCSCDYPQWEYRAKSPLRELAMETYSELFGRKAYVAAIHAGLECGYFDAGIKGLDLVSFGPNQKDVHTTKERLSIRSTENTWKLLCRLLEKLAEQ